VNCVTQRENYFPGRRVFAGPGEAARPLIDLALSGSTITPIQANPAGETGCEAGAEGATAPETLRQKDRRGMKLWKAARASSHRSPTE